MHSPSSGSMLAALLDMCSPARQACMGKSWLCIKEIEHTHTGGIIGAGHDMA